MKKYLYVLILGVFVFISGCSPAKPEVVEIPTEEVVDSLPILELVKNDTTESLTFEELQALPTTEGLAGIMSSTGAITIPVSHKGVELATLLEQIGGLTDEYSVEVVAVDGYSITFSANQILNGEFITYDAATGDEITPLSPLKVILAYEREGEVMDSTQDGQLRLVIVSDSPLQIVDGHWSVKWVAKLILKEALADWTVDFVGAIDEPMNRATFETGAADNCHQATWTDDKNQVWTGIPLWYLLGRVDDDNKHGDNAYREDLALTGYTVDVVAADGYTVTLDSALTNRNNNIIVAYLVNGNPLTTDDFPLRLVGSDLTKKEMVGTIAKIMINFPVVEVEEPEVFEVLAIVGPADATLTVTGLVDAERTFTMANLEALNVLSISVEHPKKGPINVTGVRFSELLALFTIKADAKIVKLIASDGFSAEVPLADLLACENCLAGWDEEMLRTYMPGLDTNFWVKDLATIEIK